MRGKQIERLAKQYLLPHLPGYRVKGDLLYADPVDDLFRGFYFESSSFSATAFCIYVFVLPLYIPVPGLVFTFGNRIGKTFGSSIDEWMEYSSETEPTVMAEILRRLRLGQQELLDKVVSPDDLAAKGYSVVTAPSNINIIRGVAYSLAFIGKVNEAQAELERLERSIEHELMQNCATGLQVPWLEAMQTEAATLRQALARGWSEAMELLKAWKEESIRNLRIQSIVNR